MINPRAARAGESDVHIMFCSDVGPPASSGSGSANDWPAVPSTPRSARPYGGVPARSSGSSVLVTTKQLCSPASDGLGLGLRTTWTKWLFTNTGSLGLLIQGRV